MTHSLSRPVGPPTHGPDPADVALFPVDTPRPPPPRRPFHPADRQAAAPPAPGYQQDTAAHRRPRQRTRLALAASGAVAAVVGCTALAASLLGAQGRTDETDEVTAGPSLAAPDGGGEADQSQRASDSPPAAAGTPAGEDGRGTPAPGRRDPQRTGRPSPRPSPGASRAPGPTAGGSSAPAVTPDADTGSGTDAGTDTGTGAGTGAPLVTADPAPPPPTATDDPTPPTLREGSYGWEVVELQQRLRQLGWLYRGQVNGRYDAETRAAVARFQRAYDVRDYEPGVYDLPTRTALERYTEEP